MSCLNGEGEIPKLPALPASVRTSAAMQQSRKLSRPATIQSAEARLGILAAAATLNLPCMLAFAENPTISGMPMFADFDDFHGIGAARFAEGFAYCQYDVVAGFDRAALE